MRISSTRDLVALASLPPPATLPELDRRIGRGWRLRLDGMRRCLGRFGPRRYPVVLVGGTNGKGSVAAMLHRIFVDAGFRVGLTTSPHLVDVRERIRVGEEAIAAEEFDACMREAIEADREDEGTYFETLALTAVRAFDRAAVDLAVVEIGMGGRLDAFNALDPAVSIITNVGLEHTRWLGETVEAIALEKAQIARFDRPVILGTDLPALREECERIGARVEVVLPARGGDYAAANRAVALAAARRLAEVLERPFDPAAADVSARNVWWPGRFEVLRKASEGRPEILLDGAHNPPAARALAQRLAAHAAGRRVVGYVAFLEDKDVPGWFVSLDPAVEEWVVTGLAAERALPASRVPTPYNAHAIEDRGEAWRLAEDLAGPDGIVLVSGSLYHVGQFLRCQTAEMRIWE